MAALDLTFGMWFIGTILTSCLYGVNLIQGYNYFRSYPKDPTFLKVTVASIIILDTAGTAANAHGMYWYLITHFNDPAALAIIDKTLSVESMITVIVTFMVQCFFAYSVWKVSRHNWVVTGIICVTAFAALVVGMAMGVEDIIKGFFSALGGKTFWILVGLDLGIAAICDLAITISLCYYFRVHKGGFNRTDTLLDRLIIYTINRGVVTFIVQTLNMALFIGMPDNMIWSPFHLCLSKVYIIALLATLNRRDTKVDNLMHASTTHFGPGSTNIETFRTELPTQINSIGTHDVTLFKSSGETTLGSMGEKAFLNA